jgi:hypothetical protein
VRRLNCTGKRQRESPVQVRCGSRTRRVVHAFVPVASFAEKSSETRTQLLALNILNSPIRTSRNSIAEATDQRADGL